MVEGGTRELSQLCRVLEEDSELADAIAPAQRAEASRECVASAVAVAAGEWHPVRTGVSGQGIGLLVTRGLLIRRVGVDGRFGAELLGVGDLLRPWQGDEVLRTLAVTTGWRVLEPLRLAVLDERFAHRAARYPALMGAFVARAMGRSRNLTVNMAIVQQARVDARLHMLFWHLAARWGKVRADGVSVPLRLTHGTLAELVAARRPTVTTALSELGRRGLVRTLEDGWLLTGEPPGEIRGLVQALGGVG